jgi:UDP-N-acetylmuramoyl-L-alanyl-D-glutamate--2,6-diaminopimelate ligase
MNKYEVPSVSIIGIGGSGAFYIAKFLLLCGVDVYGWNTKVNERTKELEKMGATITYHNPKKAFDTPYYIYTHNMPEDLINKYKEMNSHIDSYEVGHMYRIITEDYEDNLLNESQQKAFKESNIAPLYNLHLGDMRLIGITGTDGKTTSCSMIYHILKNNGFNPSLISTVSALIGEEEIDTGFHTTTPTSQELYKLINKAVQNKCTHLILETTSHGLEQGRVAGLKFDTVGYTNVTKEHLDYHKTYRKYLESKSLLIKDHTKPDSLVVLNMDDNSFEYLNGLALGKSMEYSVRNKKADIYATDIIFNENLKFKVHTNSETIRVNIPIYGIYNISNFLLACAVCLNENIQLLDIANSINTFETVKGRMELIQEEPFKVFVDFAHTPNATLEALKSVKEMTKRKVIHVFGCAGLRDSFKRYEMGKISNQLADITILTAEDPRTERLININDEIERGYKDGGKEGKLIRFDYDDKDIQVRRDAIKEAIFLAKEGDTILVTGKAHEQSLCFGDTEYDWNDIEETKRILNSLHKS